MVDFKKKTAVKTVAKPAASTSASKASSLRDKYRAVSIDSLKKEAEKEDKEMNLGSGRPGFLEITDQVTNKFRLYPPHSGNKFLFPVTKCWLSIEKEDGTIGRTTVFHAVKHGNLKKDPIELYISICHSLLKDAKGGADKLKKLVSEYKPNGAGNEGLRFDTTWVAYADKIFTDKPAEFGLLEVKKSVRDAIHSQAATEADDQEIEIDPYTDVDTGRPILIKYNKAAKKATDYYKTQISSKALPLTDEQLTAFDSKKPLAEIYGKVYNTKDFENAIEGLRLFDEKNDIGVFESNEFLDAIEELREQLDSASESEEVEDKPTSKTSKSTKKQQVIEEEEAEEEELEEEELEEEAEESEAEPTSDPLTDMTRAELLGFIKENSLKDVVKVFKTDSDEAIREKIREVVSFDEEKAEQEEYEEVEYEEEGAEEVEEAPFEVDEKPVAKKTAKTAKSTPTAPSKNSSVENLRNRLLNRKS